MDCSVCLFPRLPSAAGRAGGADLHTTDDIAERVRKIGGTTLRSIGHIGRLQRVLDNDADFVTPLDNAQPIRIQAYPGTLSTSTMAACGPTRNHRSSTVGSGRWGGAARNVVGIINGIISEKLIMPYNAASSVG
jgi:hypothetical protein